MRPSNLNLYQINTRVWLRRFAEVNEECTLSSVPPSYWDNLCHNIDYVWLMGVWRPTPGLPEKHCFQHGLVEEYKQALPDIVDGDVIGSPFSIDDYELNPSLGEAADLAAVRQELHARGAKLILDFVPNHFSSETALIREFPEAFVTVPESFAQQDQTNYYRPFPDMELWLAHGKDPYFDGWSDTSQVNYFTAAGRKLMIDRLCHIAGMCDGVRCDMAMLPVNRIFAETWGRVIAEKGWQRPETEFWTEAIPAAKQVNPDFLFIAEVYWDMEPELVELGFDYVYDKKLMDLFVHSSAPEVREHLARQGNLGRHMVRFTENHDEKRALYTLGLEKAKAASLAIGSLEGLTLFHDGQFEGKTVRLPVQLGREPEEHTNSQMLQWSTKLIEILGHPILRNGVWSSVAVQGSGDNTHQQFLSWQWEESGKHLLIVINFSPERGKAHLTFPLSGASDSISFHDHVTGDTHSHKKADLLEHGLYVELGGFGMHVLEYQQ